MILSKSFDLEKAKNEYAKAKPFNFCTMENFLDPYVAELAYKDFEYVIPNTNWWSYNNVFEKKYATDKWDLFPSNIRVLLAYLNTAMVTNVIQAITGLNGLIVDSTMTGAGMHMHLPGGHLDVHSDFWLHPKLKIKRKLNLLIYMNKNWKPEWNGDLEFWDKDMTKCEHKIAPLFNRAVLFDTSNGANHGLPDKVLCPPGQARKSLALYFYQALEKEDFEREQHSTMFKKRPGDKTNEEIESLRAIRNKGRLAEPRI